MWLLVKTALFILFGLLTCTTLVCAQDPPEKVQTVIVSGYGSTQEEAEQSAFRNAVQKVVGTYVLSNVEMENQKVRQDIISHSSGYIKEYTVLESSDSEVKIRATVLSSKIQAKIEKVNETTKQLALKGQAYSSQNNWKSQVNALENVFKKWPQAAYRINIGEIKFSPSNTTVELAVEWDKEWVEELDSLGKSIANETIKRLNVSGSRFPEVKNRDQIIICFASGKDDFGRGYSFNVDQKLTYHRNEPIGSIYNYRYEKSEITIEWWSDDTLYSTSVVGLNGWPLLFSESEYLVIIPGNKKFVSVLNMSPEDFQHITKAVAYFSPIKFR